MTSVSDIPVEVVNTADATQAPSPYLLALLKEIQDMLTQLLEHNSSNSIDIRSLPMMPGDYEQLKQLLGEGEVTATIDSLGPSQIRETAIPGVWWVTHHNAEDEVLTEFIEVTELPGILKAQAEDLRDAPNIMRNLLDEYEQHD
jgi:hydrogenase-1 operon protein HyaF